MQQLSLRLLGDFDVDGVEPAALGSRKGRLLLRLLALARGHAVPTGVLVDALWGDAAPANPADQLSVLVSRLRGVLGRERVEHGDAGYRLRYDWLDVDELAGLVDEALDRQRSGNPAGAAAAARAALSLLRGDVDADLLDGDWAQAHVAELNRLVARAREVAGSAFGAAGYWSEAAELAADAFARDGYDEAAARLLMRAHAEQGRPAAALAVFAELRGRLVDELGTEPAAETAALHGAILAGDYVPAAEGDGRTPVRLVGRDQQLRRLDEIAARARAGLLQTVVVEGEAGIGKTTLLRAWSARRRGAGDQVLFATCGELDAAVPLDALLVALGAALRDAGPARAAEALGGEAGLLGPLLGTGHSTGHGGGDGDGGAHDGEVAPTLADRGLEPAVLFAAVVRVLQRMAAWAPVVVIVDDAHQAGPALAALLQFVRRRPFPLLVLAAVRPGEGVPLPADVTLRLGLLDRAATEELVGAERAAELYERSHGHPLLLTQLAAGAGAGSAQLPDSLVAAVAARCDELGTAGSTLQAAAVIGVQLDLDLLAAVLHRRVVDVLADVEQAVARELLVDDGGRFAFRHELVRSALASAAGPGRSTVLHRQAGRVLARRRDADPMDVAEHARRGGDAALAAQALRAAARRAAARFDFATAEALLDDALTLDEQPAAWLERARIRTLRGHYAAAYADVARAGADPAAMEVGAWASYFDRRFEQAGQFARDGELAADDPALRARCLMVGGRTRHAAGDLPAAEAQLSEAMQLAVGPDRVTAAAWLGVVRAHQSRLTEALDLLRPATRGRAGVEHISSTLHALLFTGHALALGGRPADALECFDRYTEEVQRRQVPRFAGRGVNFGGWVLRNIGAADEARERHHEALEEAGRTGTAEVTVAALQDIAEDALARGDVHLAARRLEEAESTLVGDLVFGWRLSLRLKLLQGRVALARGDAESARMYATVLTKRASAIGVPRYAAFGRLSGYLAESALGEPVDLDAVARDLDEADRVVGLESWWWTGTMAAALHVPAWVDRAADRVADLAAAAGARGPALQAAAAPRLDGWKLAAG